MRCRDAHRLCAVLRLFLRRKHRTFFTANTRKAVTNIFETQHRWDYTIRIRDGPSPREPPPHLLRGDEDDNVDLIRTWAPTTVWVTVSCTSATFAPMYLVLAALRLRSRET